MVYMNNAATSYPKPKTVTKAVYECLASGNGLYSRGNKMGTEKSIFETRELVSKIIGATAFHNICFTSNDTVALNMILFGLPLAKGDCVVTSCIEHNSVARPLRQLEQKGVNIMVIKGDNKGRMSLEEIEYTFKTKNPKVAIFSHASNVTGNVSPIQEIGNLCRKYGVIFAVDAAQTMGCYPIDVETMNIDLLSFAGHKGLMGPQGTGGFYIREGIKLNPILNGGTGSYSSSDMPEVVFPDSFEVGTPACHDLAGLKAGLEFILDKTVGAIHVKETKLLNYLTKKLIGIPNLTLYGDLNGEKTAVVSFTLKGKSSHEVGLLLQEKGIICRSGIHCAPWAHETLGTINEGTLRLSLGYFSTKKDIDQTVNAIKQIVENH